MAPEVITVERRLAALARRAHGVVTRRELLGVGITEAQLKHRVRSGALIAVFRGVYRVGHAAPSVDAHYTAAVKACGNEALLSGPPAAYLRGLIRGPAPPPEVTAPTERRVKGVRTRRGRKETSLWRGIPVTTPAQTLVDLAAVLDAEPLARACHEAGVRYGTTPADIQAILSKRPNAKGAGKLRGVLRGDTKVTLSRLESEFLKRLREADLPLPQTNKRAGTKRVDCRWPDHKLTVELDSYRYHNSRHSWEQDRTREREARARCDAFRRYSWTDVTEDPARMHAELATLLTSAWSALPSPR